MMDLSNLNIEFSNTMALLLGVIVGMTEFFKRRDTEGKKKAFYPWVQAFWAFASGILWYAKEQWKPGLPWYIDGANMILDGIILFAFSFLLYDLIVRKIVDMTTKK